MRKIIASITLLLISVITVSYFSGCSKVCDCMPDKNDTIAKHINDSLWAYYPIKGNLYDSSGNGHELALSKTASLTYDMWGNDNGAINFNGYDSYASIAGGSLFNSQEFSVSFFVMPRQDKGLFFGKQSYISGKGATFNVGLDNVYYGFNTRFSVTKNQANICNEDPNGSFICLDPNPFQVYAWYHVVITFSKGTMQMFINGHLVQSTTIDTPVLTYCADAPFLLGTWWDRDHNALDGKIDNIRIYTRVLNSSEVTYLYNQE